MTTRRLIAEPAASEYLGVPPRTLQDWRYRGEGPPYYRTGRRIRYATNELDAWLSERRVA